MNKGLRDPEEVTFRSNLFQNPDTYYETGLNITSTSERERLLIHALNACPVWPGPNILRFKSAIENHRDISICEQLFEMAHYVDPKNPITLMNYGYYLIGAGFWDKAHAIYKTILNQHPHKLAEILPLLWLIDPSIESLRGILPRTEQGHSQFGLFLQRQKKYEHALEEYQNALQINPQNHDLRFRMINLLMNTLHEREKAIVLCEHSMALVHENSELQLKYLYLVLEGYRQLDKIQEARKTATRLMKNCHNDPNWLYRLSSFYKTIGDLFMTEQMLEKALLWDSQNPIYHEKLGDTYYQNKKWPLALLEYKKTRALFDSQTAAKQKERMDEKIRALALKAVAENYN
ncbi:hypothetical protein ACFL27_02820 [candidate division CSSED10-310 bacterium]|uniref:Tetratricopeptide repeat protein n=1 Tax=candidate division CSSED10-310 bacterium TaxID=2855610 RepID=A0ABV6YSG7_UNCC1